MSYSPENINIGHRAAAAVIERAERQRTSLGTQMKLLDVSRQQYYQWTKPRGGAPSALILARMDALGYDVRYILTGKTD